MKKKYYSGIIIVAATMAITACSSGSDRPKNEAAQLSEELEKEMNADDREAIKEVQEELKGETEKESETIFEPLQADISVSGIDPYENNLFQIFGLDNNFPRPKEGYRTEASYSTVSYPVDDRTGEKQEGIFQYSFSFQSDFYEDYLWQIKDYVVEKRPDVRIDDLNMTTMENPLEISLNYKMEDGTYVYIQFLNNKSFRILKFPYENTVIKGSVSFANLEETPDKKTMWFTVKSDNKDVNFYYDSINRPSFPYDIKEGDVVTIDYDDCGSHGKTIRGITSVNAVEREE